MIRHDFPGSDLKLQLYLILLFVNFLFELGLIMGIYDLTEVK